MFLLDGWHFKLGVFQIPLITSFHMDVSKKCFGKEMLALDTTLEEFFFVVKFC